MIVEGIADGRERLGRRLVNAFPAESVDLFDLARATADWDDARALYEWFLPLLRLDTLPKFVQLIKLAQELVGQGEWHSRPPRLALTAAERDETIAIIRHALETRPARAVRVG